MKKIPLNLNSPKCFKDLQENPEKELRADSRAFSKDPITAFMKTKKVTCVSIVHNLNNLTMLLVHTSRMTHMVTIMIQNGNGYSNYGWNLSEMRQPPQEENETSEI